MAISSVGGCVSRAPHFCRQPRIKAPSYLQRRVDLASHVERFPNRTGPINGRCSQRSKVPTEDARFGVVEPREAPVASQALDPGKVCLVAVIAVSLLTLQWSKLPAPLSLWGGCSFVFSLDMARASMAPASGLDTADSSREVLTLIIGTLANGMIGMIDDLMIVKRKNSGGLKPHIKIVLQTLFASFLCWSFYRGGDKLFHASLVLTPLCSIAMGATMLPFSVFTIVAEANSVNLTDGLDGLAAGTCTISLSGMALILSSHNLALATMCAAMCGGCVGFLFHNRHPAKLFMGNTGALGLGSFLGFVGVVANAFVPLTIMTSVFALEAMSVILQAGYYFLTRKALGRGVHLFKMSPFHHHLEVCGWHETKITPLFYLAASVMTLVAIQFGPG